MVMMIVVTMATTTLLMATITMMVVMDGADTDVFLSTDTCPIEGIPGLNSPATNSNFAPLRGGLKHLETSRVLQRRHLCTLRDVASELSLAKTYYGVNVLLEATGLARKRMLSVG